MINTLINYELQLLAGWPIQVERKIHKIPTLLM